MSREDRNDSELVAACLEGSDSAWAALVDRYSRLVYSIPTRRGLPRHLCEEIYQSVWTIAVRHLGQLRDVQSLPAWLIRTAQRETWRAARADARSSGEHADAADLHWADPAEAELLEERQRLRDALAGLDERCRRLLLLLFQDDRPDYNVVAEQLGMPRGSIGPTRGRCLEKLRGMVAEPTGLGGASRAARGESPGR